MGLSNATWQDDSANFFLFSTSFKEHYNLWASVVTKCYTGPVWQMALGISSRLWENNLMTYFVFSSTFIFFSLFLFGLWISFYKTGKPWEGLVELFNKKVTLMLYDNTEQTPDTPFSYLRYTCGRTQTQQRS